MEFWFSILTLLVSCAITSFVTHYLFEFKKRHSLLMTIGVTLCCSLVIAIGNGFGRPVRTSDELTIDDPKAFWPVVGILILAFMAQSIICFVWYFWNKFKKPKTINPFLEPQDPLGELRFYDDEHFFADNYGPHRTSATSKRKDDPGIKTLESHSHMELWKQLGLMIAIHAVAGVLVTGIIKVTKLIRRRA